MWHLDPECLQVQSQTVPPHKVMDRPCVQSGDLDETIACTRGRGHIYDDFHGFTKKKYEDFREREEIKWEVWRDKGFTAALMCTYLLSESANLIELQTYIRNIKTS